MRRSIAHKPAPLYVAKFIKSLQFNRWIQLRYLLIKQQKKCVEFLCLRLFIKYSSINVTIRLFIARTMLSVHSTK